MYVYIYMDESNTQGPNKTTWMLYIYHTRSNRTACMAIMNATHVHISSSNNIPYFRKHGSGFRWEGRERERSLPAGIIFGLQIGVLIYMARI